MIRDRFVGRPEFGPLPLLLYTVSALSMLGVTFISPILPVMIRDLAMTETEVAWMMTLYTLPAVVFTPAAGWLADRFRRDRVLASSLILFGATGAAIFFTASIDVILGLRFVQGIGAAAITPITGTLIGDLFEDEVEVGAQGMRIVSMNIAKFIYPILGGVLAAIAWHVPYLLFLIAIPSGLVVIGRFPDATGETPPLGDYRTLIVESAREPAILVSYTVAFVRFFVKYGAFTFLTVIITSYGIGSGSAGLVLSIWSLGLAVMATQSRFLASLASLESIVIVGLFVSSLVAVGFGIVSSLPLFLLLGALYGIGEGIAAPFETSLITQNTPPETRATLVSFRSIVTSVSKTVAPVMLAVVAQRTSLRVVFFVMGAVGMVGAGLIVVLLIASRGREALLGEAS